jgi:hypothetical protein
MVAYTLPADTNMTAIADGRRCALLAEPRPGGTNTSHPRPGGAVHLTAAGTKDRPRRKADPKRLAFRADLHLSSDGVVRVINGETTPPRTGGHQEPHEAHRRSQLVERLLNAVEQGAPTPPDKRAELQNTLAAMAGFKDWPALFAGAGGRGGEIVVKTLLVWIEPAAPADGEQAETA